MAGDLVDTTEMYLKAVYELEEEGVQPLRARLVERLEQSKPTVSETVARLERADLLYVDPERTIRLTDAGRAQATNVMRKHRLAERLLLDVIGMPWESVHNEACRWEHVMSDAVEEKIAGLLAKVEEDPFGNPIPAPGTLGPGAQAAGEGGLRSLGAFLAENPEGGNCTLGRIGEALQTDEELLAQMAEAGALPGARLAVERDVVGALVQVGNEVALPLSEWACAHLLVA